MKKFELMVWVILQVTFFWQFLGFFLWTLFNAVLSQQVLGSKQLWFCLLYSFWTILVRIQKMATVLHTAKEKEDARVSFCVILQHLSIQCKHMCLFTLHIFPLSWLYELILQYNLYKFTYEKIRKVWRKSFFPWNYVFSHIYLVGFWPWG